MSIYVEAPVYEESEKPSFRRCYCLNADGRPKTLEQQEAEEDSNGRAYYDEEEEFYHGIPVDGDGVDWGFSDPGGVSALRAATHDYCPRHGCHKAIDETDSYCRNCGQELNPRKFPCPTCGAQDVLTQADVNHHYQCDQCADRLERGLDI
jgi:predicted RNA-binding Zn-ribbon protein involved in translation (DUF1610 family)